MEKRIIIIFIISCICLFTIFGDSGHTHNHSWKNNGDPKFATFATFNGTIAHCVNSKDQVTYSITMYSLPNSAEAWNTYVSNGYRLKYIGGNYWHDTSNSWAEEPSNLNDYIYPAYIDYLRPY